MQITPELVSKVKRVYSGKPGCMCGCNGKWTNASDNQRSTKIIFGKLLRNHKTIFDSQANCFYVESETRVLAAYLD